MRIVRLRPKAEREIDQAAAYYARSDVDTALRLYGAVDRALVLLSRNPSIGTLRYAHLLPGGRLRMWPLRRFPYLVFYLDVPPTLDVLRFLHARRDIPAVLQEEA
jgi:toxin ParE1/3/4